MADHEVETKGASFSRTCFNAVNALIAVPYTLAQAGWFGICFLIVTAIITCYTGILIRRRMDSIASIRIYSDIFRHSFGKISKIILSILMYLELFLAPTGFLILGGDNGYKLFPHVGIKLAQLQIGGKQFLTVAAGLTVLPSMWSRDLSWLSYASDAGVFSSIIMVSSVFWVGAGANDGIGFSSKGELFKPTGIPTIISTYAYCYAGHSVLPALYSSMRDKRHVSMVLFISSGFCTLCYMLKGIIGYLMFGQSVSSQVTLNLPENKLSSKIAIYTTLVGPIAKYALIITPVATAMEACLPARYRSNRFICMLVRTLLLASSVTLALVFPYFGILMPFCRGLSECNFLSIVVPCICFLKISRAQQNYWDLESVMVVGILSFAFSIAILGTYTSVRDIIKQFI